MEISYTVSEDDFVKAGRLMLKKRSPFLRVLPWMMVAVLLYFVIGLATSADMRASTIRDGVARAAGGLILPFLIALLPLIQTYSLRKTYRKTPILSERRTLLIDNEGLEFRSHSAQGHVSWSAYVSCLEDKSNFLLVQQGKLVFVPIPKRELTVPVIDALRVQFQTHIPGK